LPATPLKFIQNWSYYSFFLSNMYLSDVHRHIADEARKTLLSQLKGISILMPSYAISSYIM
jgi:hypothetical protein